MDQKQAKAATCNNLVFIRTLGAGYNAKVKSAYDKLSGQYVAVKIIKKINKSNLSTLQNELNLMQKLKHSNITQLLDVQQNQDYIKKNGQTKKVTFIVLELAEGGELFDFVASSGAFPVEVARSYFLQLLSALDYAHSHSIAHRDLKPENLLFDKAFNLKVADWGFGAILNGLKRTTQLGTESYMAPEIHSRTAYNADEVDLFAAGIVLFIMVVGTPPFTRAVKTDPYYNLIANPKYTDKFWAQHQRFRKDKPALTNEFKDLLTAMLQVNPKNRLTLKQIKAHPFMQGKILHQQDLTAQFIKRKQLVDIEIANERKKKEDQKKRQNQQPNGHAPTGFRSLGEESQQQFNQLESLFDLQSQRFLQELHQQTNKTVNVLYSCLEAPLLYKYLLLACLEENVASQDIKLNTNGKFKFDFSIHDEDEVIEVEATISAYDDQINQVSFMRKNGNIIAYYNYVKNIKEQLIKINQSI